MFDPYAFASQLLGQNMPQGQPGGQQNNTMQEYAKVIQSRDNKRGEEIANNILKTYGISKEQALQMAQQRFGIRF